MRSIVEEESTGLGNLWNMMERKGSCQRWPGLQASATGRTLLPFSPVFTWQAFTKHRVDAEMNSREIPVFKNSQSSTLTTNHFKM